MGGKLFEKYFLKEQFLGSFSCPQLIKITELNSNEIINDNMSSNQSVNSDNEQAYFILGLRLCDKSVSDVVFG